MLLYGQVPEQIIYENTSVDLRGGACVEEFFAFSGRVRRMSFWVNSLLSFLAFLIVVGIASGVDNAIAGVFAVLVYLVLVIRSLSVGVRRCHDLNKSGAWVLIALVPLIGGIWALVMQGFMAGDEGANSFGPAPEPGQLI
jgi:uncharacterized membrane protein YhaH (DUF805 family)